MSQTERTKLNNIARKLMYLILFCFFIVVFIGAEHVSRYIDKRNGADHLTRIQRSIRLKEHHPLKSLSFYPNPLIHDQLEKRIVYRVDKNGFIKPSRVYEEADSNIFFLGGSTTACLALDERMRFPYLTGVLLSRELKKKVNGYNGGVSGNNSLHSINILINKVLPLRPDIVVMMHNVNDLVTLLNEGTYWNNNQRRSPIVTKNRRSVYNLLRDFVHGIGYAFLPSLSYRIGELKQLVAPPIRRNSRGDSSGTDDMVPAIDMTKVANSFERNLNIFVSVCVSTGVTPVLMTQATAMKIKPDSIIRNRVEKNWHWLGIDYSSHKRNHEMLNEIIRKVCRQRNVLLIDLEKLIPRERKYFYDVIHFKNIGSKLVAEIIASKLAPLVKTK